MDTNPAFDMGLPFVIDLTPRVSPKINPITDILVNLDDQCDHPWNDRPDPPNGRS